MLQSPDDPQVVTIMPHSAQPPSTTPAPGQQALQPAQEVPPNSWSDQPPTQAGNPRTRVYVACQTCRSRKIKCDGLKPTCTNCLKKDYAPGPQYQHLIPASERHKLQNGICSYDELPKRRGPDRLPGARVRKKSRPDVLGHERSSRRRENTNRHFDTDRSGSEKVQYSHGAGVSTQTIQDTPAAYDHHHHLSSQGGLPVPPPPRLSTGFVDASSSIDSNTRLAQRQTSYDQSHSRLSPPGSATSSNNDDSSLRSPARSHERGLHHDGITTSNSALATGYSPMTYRPPFHHNPPSSHAFTSPHDDSHSAGHRVVDSRNGVPSVHPPPSSSPATYHPVSPIAHFNRDRQSSWSRGHPSVVAAQPPAPSHHTYLPSNPSYEYVPSAGAYIQSLEESDPEDPYRQSPDETTISLPMVPGSKFVQKTWFEALLEKYASFDVSTNSRDYYSAGSLMIKSEDRARAQDSIVSDLRLLFARSSWWFSFIHIPTFWARFFTPHRRVSSELQPGLIYAALALGTFFKSSESEGGLWGREKASQLRMEAEAAVENSLAVGWIDTGLAQAAWLLAMYEMCPHPYHTLSKVRSAIHRLDNIIRMLKFSTIDDGNPAVTRFDKLATPLPADGQLFIGSAKHRESHPTGYSTTSNTHLGIAHEPELVYPISRYVAPVPTTAIAASQSYVGNEIGHHHHHHHVVPFGDQGTMAKGCNCQEMTLGENCPESGKYSPLWHFTPRWVQEHDPGEVQREEARRIVWSYLILASGFSTHTATLGTERNVTSYWSTQPENFSILYPGEAAYQFDFSSPLQDYKAKNSVWALYSRAQLLWLACLRMRQIPLHSEDYSSTRFKNNEYGLYSASLHPAMVHHGMSDSELAAFTMKAWLQVQEIENALDRHTCNIERAFLFQGREYLSSVRMIITQEFSRFVPIPNSGTNSLFNRHQADDWLKHQSAVVQRIVHGMQHVTGQKLNVLAHRPFFVWWFMSQVVRLLNLWTCDRSMKDAVELCFGFLPAIDYLTILWPCENQRSKYFALRQRLDDACIQCGIPLPPPSQVNFGA